MNSRRQGVKVLHQRRDEIKRRMQEKQLEQQRRHRQARLSGLREGDDNLSGDTGCASGQPQPIVEDWASFGAEIGCNVLEADVMAYLLALEEEIRQEGLVALYEDGRDCDWEDYFQSLTS